MKVLVILVCGCNSAFGLDGTHPRHDFFDAMTDAPYACPPMGGTPAFQPGLYQAFQQTCQSYAITAKGSAEHAMALCPGTNGDVLAYGDPDAMLTVRTAPVPATTTLRLARLAPDDDQAIVTFDDYSSSTLTHHTLYQRQTDDSWQPVADIASTSLAGLAQPSIISTPTSGAHRHAIMLDYAQRQLIELVEGDGKTFPWVAMMLQPFDTVALYPSGPLSLSPDGLRLVFFATSQDSSENGIYYTDRPALGAPFAPPRWVSALPHTYNTDPFLTDNCARLYLSGLDSIFYAAQ